MKKVNFFVIAMLITILSIAQAPNAFKYQTVVRDASNAIIANQAVNFRISILEGSSSGPAVFVETHSATTNALGIVNLSIGTGTLVSGNFAAIDWGNNSYYVKIEIDPTGGTTYQLMGTSQLLSVPYALYAAESGGSSWTVSGNNIYNNNTGNVGIGVTTPLSKLDVSNVFGVRGGSSDYNHSIFNEFGGLVINSYNVVGSPDLVSFIATGRNSGNYSSSFAFLTKPSGGTPTERMRILSNGKIGIGTNNPSGLLTVDGGGAGIAFPSIRANNSDAAGIALFATANSTDAVAVFDQANTSGIIAKFFGGGAADIVRISRDGSNARGRIAIFGNNTTADVGGWVHGSPYFGLVMGEIVAGSYNAVANIYNVSGAQALVPWTSSVTLGNSTWKWNAVWATNGTIQTSDKNKKENIQDISYGLDAVMKLKPISFQWKDKEAQVGTGKNLGFLAQDLELVIPDVVIHTYTSQEEIENARKEKGIELDPESYGVKYSELIPVLVKAIQEQQAIIESLQKQIDELKSQMK